MRSTRLCKRSLFIQPNDALLKQQTRKKFRALRQAISFSYRESAAQQAAQILLQAIHFQQSKTIACYIAVNDEFLTQPIIEAIWQTHKQCYLPVLTAENTLQFAHYAEQDVMQANRYGIPEPVNTHRIPAEQLDMVILPLLAFDLQGHRLGTGGGYYDKTFAFLKTKSATHPLLIGLGFAAQQADHLPNENFDVDLDAVLTEKDFTFSAKN